MSINSFKAALSGGGARPNQFEVIMTLPSFAGNIGDASKFLVEATSLPGSSMGVAPANFKGRLVPFSGERTFQPWQITVVNDTDFKIYNALEKWIHYMNDVSENTGEARPASYCANEMTVNQLGRRSEILKAYNFVSVFPSDLSPIALSFGDNDNIERFNVTFQYSYWTTPTLGNK